MGILLQQVMDSLAEDRILCCLQIKTALLLPLYLLYSIPFSCLTVLVLTMMLNRCGERGPSYPRLNFCKV